MFKQMAVAALATAAFVSTAVLADPPGGGHGRHQGGPAAQAPACDHGGRHAQGSQPMRGHHGEGHEHMAQRSDDHRGHGGHAGQGRRGDHHRAQPGNAGAGCPMHEPPKST